MKGPSSLSTFDVLRIRDYRLLIVCAIGSVLGSTMLMLARGYLAYELTGSAAILGFITLSQGVPQLLLSLIGGVIADRVDKRRLLMFTQGGLALIGAATAVLVHTGLIEIWHLVVMSFLQGSFFSFTGPSRQALMIDIVGVHNVGKAVALNNVTTTTSSIIGPAAAGFLIAIPVVGLTATMYLITVIYFIPVLALQWMETAPLARPQKAQAVTAEFVKGVKFVSGHAMLRPLVLAGMVAMVLGNPYQQLLPVFASDKVLDVGASGLGLMSTCIGIGAMAGSLTVANLAPGRPLPFILTVTGSVFGVGLVVFSLMSVFPLALLVLVLVGFTFSAFQTLNNTLAITYSTPEFYGRISSIQQLNWSLASMAVLPLGVAVDAIGAPAVVMIAGATLAGLFLLLPFVSGAFSRSVREPVAEQRLEAEGGAVPARGREGVA